MTAPFHPFANVDGCSASSISSRDSASVVESSGVASGPLGASAVLTGMLGTSADESEALALCKVLRVAWVVSEVLLGFSALLAVLWMMIGILESSVVLRDGRRLPGAELVTVLTSTSLVPRKRCCRAPLL